MRGDKGIENRGEKIERREKISTKKKEQEQEKLEIKYILKAIEIKNLLLFLFF